MKKTDKLTNGDGNVMDCDEVRKHPEEKYCLCKPDTCTTHFRCETLKHKRYCLGDLQGDTPCPDKAITCSCSRCSIMNCLEWPFDKFCVQGSPLRPLR